MAVLGWLELCEVVVESGVEVLGAGKLEMVDVCWT